MMELFVQRLSHAEGLPLPAYAKPGDAGLDLRAALPPNATVFLSPGDQRPIPTGFAFEIPDGYYGQIAPRSGLARDYGIKIDGGVVDSSFRGEVAVILHHAGNPNNSAMKELAIRRGDRIAQLLILPVRSVIVREADALSETARGAGGFGSTGR